MKQVHASYSFVASTKTITLTGLNIDQDQLLLIVNATRGVQYFNFADSSLRGAVTPGANTTVVLTDASTTGHSNSDALVIYYDDQVTTQAVSGTVTANPGTGAFTVSGTVGLDSASLVALENITVTVSPAVLGTVTISNFPSTQTIAGTVTANVFGKNSYGNNYQIPVYLDGDDASSSGIHISFNNEGNESSVVGASNPLPISGTVTVGAMPNGALTTRFGSVTTANTAQLTSAVTNTSRKYLLVQNIATSTVTIGIGFAPTTTQGIQLSAGAGLTFDSFCPTGGVWWLSGVTSSNFCVIEG